MGMTDFISAHWHCILPLVAVIIVSAFLLRGEKRGDTAKGQNSATDGESQAQISNDRRAESETYVESET
jgi:hypothetical protein